MEQQEQRALTGGSAEALQQGDKRLLGAATGKLLTRPPASAASAYLCSIPVPCSLEQSRRNLTPQTLAPKLGFQEAKAKSILADNRSSLWE